MLPKGVEYVAGNVRQLLLFVHHDFDGNDVSETASDQLIFVPRSVRLVNVPATTFVGAVNQTLAPFVILKQP